ncbi:MAG: hypothetical protein NTW50_02535 [Candidatus Berkelbacteria bacterium]|nr:hypothetical protein [Candidatus Berkelbacteria bacterium]
MPIVFDKEKARADAQVIAAAWLRRSEWLPRWLPPEIQFHPVNVQKGSKLHACFLFLSGYVSRSGQSANQAIGKASELTLKFPELVLPEKSLQPSLELWPELNRLIAFSKQDPKRVEGWVENLGRIRNEFGSDPRNIFLDLNFDQTDKESIWAARNVLIDRIDGFYGIAHKIAQLLIPWFQAVDWDYRQDEWQKTRLIPAVPVDHWLMRQTKQWAWVLEYGSDSRDHISRPISDFLSRICLDDELSWYDFAQGCWHISARICSQHRRLRFQNTTRSRQWCVDHCPAFSFCQGHVPANRAKTNRGSILWDSFEVHPEIELTPNLFGQP